MEENSAEEHHYYYPLPASAPKADSNLSDAEKGGTCAEENSLHNKPSTSQSNNPAINKYALGGAILASTNSILLGYDIGVMSGAALFIRQDLKITSVQVEILVGCLNVCSLIGSLASGKTSDLIGRRYTIMIAAATFMIGAILMGLAPSFLFLMVGRVVAGIGVGYSLMISPVYVAELSPALTRGLLTSLPEVFISVGILLGYVSNYTFSSLPNDINWRIMLGVAVFPAFAVALGVLAMPESPRWLVVKGRYEEAKQVLIRTSENKGEAELRLAEIQEAASASITGKDKGCSSSDSPNNSGTWHGQGVWKELLVTPTRPVFRILVAAIGVNFFMQASGNDAVIYYSPEVFKEAGIVNEKQLVGVTIIMGITKTCFVLISAMFMDRFGRRPMLMLGSCGMAMSLFLLGFGCTFLKLYGDTHDGLVIALCVVAVCATVSFFSIGLGPTTWVYSSEIFPLRLRAQGSSLAISVNRVVSGIVSMTFLSVSEAITFGGMFFVLGGVMVCATFFFYYFLPETKGKNLEEIEALFEDQTRPV
ncbi:probable polyol transporter 6 [Vigna umbellata]|uniref:probable polyol transporter 6 n=1 Tax=Vigna umbellata TaxID=87088 RepID=UPI001F5F17F5|nr:probable polyol transporter 6 [Vigna umbellata]